MGHLWLRWDSFKLLENISMNAYLVRKIQRRHKFTFTYQSKNYYAVISWAAPETSNRGFRKPIKRYSMHSPLFKEYWSEKWTYNVVLWQGKVTVMHSNTLGMIAILSKNRVKNKESSFHKLLWTVDEVSLTLDILKTDFCC